jgi:hypothetical protein
MTFLNARMLDSRNSELAPGPRLQKPIRRLCAAGGKRYGLRLYLKDSSHGFTGILDRGVSLPAIRVN